MSPLLVSNPLDFLSHWSREALLDGNAELAFQAHPLRSNEREVFAPNTWCFHFQDIPERNVTHPRCRHEILRHLALPVVELLCQRKMWNFDRVRFFAITISFP